MDRGKLASRRKGREIDKAFAVDVHVCASARRPGVRIEVGYLWLKIIYVLGGSRGKVDAIQRQGHWCKMRQLCQQVSIRRIAFLKRTLSTIQTRPAERDINPRRALLRTASLHSTIPVANPVYTVSLTPGHSTSSSLMTMAGVVWMPNLHW
jgi:hypothetical protein